MVVVSRASMSTGIPLLVGAGPLPELRMREACTALADCWGLDLSHICEGESPLKLLSDSAAQQGLVRLSGDAARQRPDGGSWLDALADWRHPLLLLVAGEPDGSVAGSAAAYTALCHQLGAPLIGLVQIGAQWNRLQRRRDGLPWIGWIPAAGTPERELALNHLVQHLSQRTVTAAATGAATPRP